MVHPLIARGVGVSWLGLLIDRGRQGFFFEFRHGVEDGDSSRLLMRMKHYLSSHNSFFATTVLRCDLYETDARRVTRWAKYLRQLTCNHRNLLHLDEHVTPAFLPQKTSTLLSP